MKCSWLNPGGESWNSLAIHRHIGCKCCWILSDHSASGSARSSLNLGFLSTIWGWVKTYEITIVGRLTGYGKYYVIKFLMFSAHQSKLFLIFFDELMNSRQWTKNLALNWLLSLWMTSFPSNMCCWSPTLLLYHWHVLIACCAHDMSLRSSFSVFQPSLWICIYFFETEYFECGVPSCVCASSCCTERYKLLWGFVFPVLSPCWFAEIRLAEHWYVWHCLTLCGYVWQKILATEFKQRAFLPVQREFLPVPWGDGSVRCDAHAIRSSLQPFSEDVGIRSHGHKDHKDHKDRSSVFFHFYIE